ncbi:MAG TPA: exodeoxyribonuclease V subunit gamma [Acidimicrobiales bacterium]|nr:exodeoxyribonuclease V subunit gamma [Acidimicrobiales bacterium]
MLHVHRSDRADDLVAQLAELVAVPLPDPMQAEVVSVPTQGIERWLSQRLSGHLGTSPGAHDGVCANVDFPFPGSLISGALAQASGVDPKADPWLPERAVWPLMEVVEEHFADPWLAPLAKHIENSETVEGSKRFSSIRHVADLFDRYAIHRPDMVQRWAAGSPQLGEATWQVDLWRLLRERIGQPGPAERLVDACQRLRKEPELLELPPRLSLFGLTRLAASYLDVLDAIAKGREVHLFLLHPSPALWARLQPEVDASSRFVVRAEDPTASVPNHPLLASWGRDAREMQLVLGGAVPHGQEVVAPTDEPVPRLLRRIQDDIRFDRPPAGTGSDEGERPVLAADDDSIRVHSCHGRGRQVEVLRDAVLHLLAEDPTLEPRDVIVMCPDIEHFAPLIQATFGAHDLNDGPFDPTRQLQIRLADRSLRQTNPVMGVLAEVMELASARITASEVLDLAGRDPVRRRFGFSDDDLFRLEEWVNGAFVRWGFDAEHRRTFQLADIDANTWHAGLDRILLGVAMAEDGQRLFGETLPLDDVDSGDIELAGRLAEFVHRLQRVLDELSGVRTVRDWADTLARASDALSATTPRDDWQRMQLSAVLEELVAEATAGEDASGVELSCDDIRSIMTDRLKGKPTRANFRTGHLTVCTLVPMRSIPHRVVCLLGLDDGSFPRHIERDGDDLTARAPRVGDRDVRSEDRQLLLDALLAARDHLVITYSGRDERSNLPRPPAVPVGELLDVVDHTVRAASGRARDAIVVKHPLQPFDPRNFEARALAGDGPWSFDALHLAGAEAALTPRRALPPFLASPLPPYEGNPIGLDQMERFLRHPVRAFLRERLNVSLRNKTREFEDAIPIELDSLEQWQIADRVLQAQLAGATQGSCLAAEVARGALPPGQLADSVLGEITGPLDELVQAGLSAMAPESVDVLVDLPGGSGLVGTVAGVRGDVIHTVTYSKLGPAPRLYAWLRLLALTATAPDRAFEAYTIGRSRSSRATITVARLGPLGPDAASRKTVAERHLHVLVDLFLRGMCEPLPLYLRTSAAWAEAVNGGRDPEGAATPAWTSQWRMDKEDKDAEHALVLGADVTFDDMLGMGGAPQGDEGGWEASEPTRFGVYARRLWDGLLAHEQVTDR